MAFKVRKLTYRPWPVTVKFPECDAQGNVTEVAQTFVAHFKPLTEAERAAHIAAVDKAFPPPEEKRVDMGHTLARNAAYFADLLVGWGPEVTDAAGAPLPFSAAALTELVTGPDGIAFSTALVMADNEIRYGIAPAKNSTTSLAPGAGAGEGAISSPTT